MDKKQPTVTEEPMGMCEKLFHALQTNTAFRPIRRLTFGRQDQTDATAANDKVDNPPPPPSFNDYSLSLTTPIKPHKTDKPKTNNQLPPAKQVTTTLVDKLTPPKKANMGKVENKVRKETIDQEDKVSPITKASPFAPTTPDVRIITPTNTTKIEPKDSRKMLVPTPAPPRGSISRQTTPPPTTTGNPKKNINEKVEDYIQRAKSKFRTGSGVGKAPSSDN